RDKGLAGETLVDSVKLNKGKLTHKFEKLPRYDVITDGQIIDKADGHAFLYTVEEIMPDGFSQKTSMSSVDLKGNIQTTFENEVDQKPVQITVKKTWDDEAFDGRPESVQFELTAFAEGTEVDLSNVKTVITLPEDGLIEGNAWTYTWEGLDRYADNGQVIAYDVQELGIDALETLGYTSTKEGKAGDSAFTFTNKRTPDPELDKEAKIARGLATRPEPKIELENRNEEVTYTLKTKIPDREKIESFVITDTLKDVMEFVSTPESVEVKIEGHGRISGVVSIEENTLTVTLEKQYLAKKNAAVTVTFIAKIREKMPDGSEVNLAPYIKESGRPEVDNTAFYQIKVPDAPAEEPVPSNEIIIIPPETELTKEVNGSETVTMVLENKSDPIPYTLKTMIPERGGLTEFVITDTLEDVLEFAKDEQGNLLPVTVKVGGTEVENTAQISGQTLTVNLGSYVADEYKGQPVVIDFTARFRADATSAQLAVHIDETSRKVKVPNQAHYRLVADGKVKEDDSNKVFVTPPDNKPEKTVEDETKKTMKMTNRDQEIPYTITAEVPARKDMVALSIEDTIDKVLKFKEGADITATADGTKIPDENITTVGQKLTVIVPEEYVQKPGTKIVVKFTAAIREDAVIDDSYISEDDGDGLPRILNVGYLKITVPGPKEELIPTDETKVIPPGVELDKKVGNNATHKNLTTEDPVADYTLTVKIPTRKGLTKLVIEDALDEMLTFHNGGDVRVNVGGRTVTGIADVDGQKLTVTLEGQTLTDAQGMTATITFKAVVSDKATPEALLAGNYLNKANNRIEIPNTASYALYTEEGGDEPEDQDTTDPVTVTPPEDQPKKTAEAENVPADESQIEIARNQIVTYTITAQVPLNDKLDTFRISDTIIGELEFVDGTGNPTLKVIGEEEVDLTQTHPAQIDENPEDGRERISVTIRNAERYKGQTAVFTFQAKIRKGADLSQYISGSGKPELPNTGEVLTIKLPGDDPKTTPTNRNIIIPDDPDPEKKVNGQDGIKLEGLDEEITYTITTLVPERDKLETFEIVDTLEDVLEFSSAQNAVIVKVNGRQIYDVAKINGQTLTVTFPKRLLTLANMGKEVTVEFKAKVRDVMPDGSPVDLTKYLVDAETGATLNDVEIPNRATVYVNNDPKETNKVTVTPDDPEPEKKAGDGNTYDTHYDMPDTTGNISYRIATLVPTHGNIEKFELFDTLVDELEFRSGAGDVTVTIDGREMKGLADINGQTLTVTIDGATAAANLGKEVVVVFEAGVREGADIMKYLTADSNNRVEIPNIASYKVSFPNGFTEKTTEKSTVTPGDPEITKEVTNLANTNPDKTHLYLENYNGEMYRYTLRTEIAKRTDIHQFLIEDTLVDEMQFESGISRDVKFDAAKHVKVKVNNLDADAVIRVLNDRTLDIELADKELAKAGATVEVTFYASLKPYADLAKYADPVTGEINVPNTAGYAMAYGDSTSARSARRVTKKTSNTVYVTPLDPEQITFSVTKTWEDANNQDGKRPESIAIRLYADGEEVTSKSPAYVTAATQWKVTFTGIDKIDWYGNEIKYTVLEDVVDSYTTTYNEVAGGTEITNSYTPELTNVNVVKIWNDAGNRYAARPASVTVRLLADGRATGRSMTLSAANGWTGTFANLDRYANGQIIDYTITEDAVARYTATISRTGTYSFRVTNSLSDIPTTPTPDPDPTPTPTPGPGPAPEEPEVLGATRVRATDTPEVLGARRGKTGDEFDATQHMLYLLCAASACVLFALCDGKKREEEE
ncbi:MAG: isopeptide-forming domain-containing fimbrial protein, partial [Lachnospiraceae bacterium]|nr:isopeptide-forming domain-containing fimbrial protein [Lachnospiraceae bacterium]